MAGEVDERAPEGSGASPPLFEARFSSDDQEIWSPLTHRAMASPIEWALALDMVRCAGTKCRTRTAAAQELASHVRRWMQQRVREADETHRHVAEAEALAAAAKARAEEAEARAAAAEARAKDAEARARQAEGNLAASEADRVAAERRADEAREWIRRLYQSAQRGSKAAAGPFERRTRRAFTARSLRSERG